MKFILCSVFRKQSVYPLMSIIFCILCFGIQATAQVRIVRVKKNHFLMLRDRVIVPQDDTLIFLPSSTKYKVRRDYESYLQNKYIAYLWGQVYRQDPVSICTDDTTVVCTTVNPYLVYQGKYLRNIYITKMDVFGGNIDDTVFVKKRMIDKIGDFLHEKTKTFVVTDNLFIRKDSIVDQNRLSDNERLLRTLPYMHDARIFVREIPNETDSVDVEVIVQDVYSLGGSFNPLALNYYNWNGYDQNFLGMGQSIEYKGQFKTTLDPNLSSEFTYIKNNLLGTFINPMFRYSQLNGGAQIGNQNEYSLTAGFNRDLYMPTSRVAGGYSFSNNWSVNSSKLVDTAFYNYKYNINDVWGGITFSNFKRKGDEIDLITKQNRARIFLAARYYDRSFARSADQHLAKISPIYNAENFALGQLTYFKYDFYKAKYIYGFGRTEDIPFGYSYQVNSGFDKKLDTARFYFGTEFFKIWARPSGLFYFLDIGGSSYYNSIYKFQDIYLKGSGTLVTRVRKIGNWKYRVYVSAAYTKITNPQMNGFTNINGVNGLEQFSSLSLFGYQSNSLSASVNLFPKFKLLGFRFAFILLTEVAQIGSSTDFLFKNTPYMGLGAGFRTKNENLALDEFELRVYCYPNAPDDVTMIKIVTISTPRLRINIKGIGKPAFIGF
jgi:hypothetical protein